MRFATRRVLPFLLPFMALALFVPAAMAGLTVKANHDHVEIDLNYHGSTVSASGISGPGSDIILKISADDGEEHLMKKDKVGGLIWMNTDKLLFEQVPGVYLLRSTRDPEEILGRDELTANGIGFGALAGSAVISPLADPAGKQELIDEFIRYKEKKHLYATEIGGINITSEGDSQAFYTEFDWPHQAPPGEYTMTAYEVREGRVVDIADAVVTVEETGVVKALVDLAEGSGAVYGIAAIAVALAAGFGVGMIFKGGSSH